MNKMFIIGIVLFALLLVFGIVAIWRLLSPPSHPIGVTASCDKLQHFETNLGVINYPQFKIGFVFSLDPKSKKGDYVGQMSVDDSSTDSQAEPQDITSSFNTDLSLSFAADVPEVVKSELKTQVQRSGRLVLKGAKRASLKDPIGNIGKPIRDNIISILAKHPETIICVVHSTINATSLDLSLQDQREGASNADVFKIGKYSFHVKLKCDEAYTIAGKNVPIFFKANPIGYDKKTDSFYIDTTRNVVFSSYDLSGAY